MANVQGRVLRAQNAYHLRKNRPDDPNLDNLAHNWDRYKKRLIVFLGAGASVGARGGVSGKDALPTAVWLRNELWREFMLTKATRDKFDFSSLGMMTLEHASALIESRSNRSPLVEIVSSMYTTNRPLWCHLVLPLLGPRALFTTNYDQLIEQGWQACRTENYVKASLTPIFHEDQRLDPSVVPLFKPHGSIDQAANGIGDGGLVLTMFDYFTMLTEKRKLLKEWLAKFKATCAIFVGYSFMDMDIAGDLFQLRQGDHDFHWYAVFPRGDEDVRRMYYDKFKIQQINRTFYEFLVDLDAAVDFLPRGLKPAKIPELRKHVIQ
jgi:SIR2-like domain